MALSAGAEPTALRFMLTTWVFVGVGVALMGLFAERGISAAMRHPWRFALCFALYMELVLIGPALIWYPSPWRWLDFFTGMTAGFLVLGLSAGRAMPWIVQRLIARNVGTDEALT
jgi:hypothetical protein